MAIVQQNVESSPGFNVCPKSQFLCFSERILKSHDLKKRALCQIVWVDLKGLINATD